ncbi:DUF1735 and LamG domain-containing protein [uncultured Alistipes sp.]|uniref:DUF1735 and LamG domain-containing protein n=1 Tax=uncultured Alistipes sp. TaxID=538949 RepID=UPI0025F02FEE|nr:DUF1735 and LamG domain-containing protein [uncultured Alistipes sp.]
MKFDKISLTLFLLAAVAFTGCKNEDPAEHHFDNKLYISSAQLTDDLLIRDDIVSDSRTISARLALPAKEDVTVTFEARPDLAARYNMVYGDNAVGLPAEYFSIPEKVISIGKGNVTGNDIVVNFTNTNELNGDLRYVLPVTVADIQGISLLESTRTVYFVFKGAALINVVADISEMYFPVNWSSSVNVSGLKTVTVEALVRSSDWEAGRGNALSSVFGIEGTFLVRIGDADRPRNQLQLVNPNGNWPSPNAAPGLPVNEWIHIAVVWDATTGERIYYQNGEVVASDNAASGSVSLNSGCYVGKSYDDSRWLPGEISELRIWNIQRTQEQIASSMYTVDPTTPGLLAYWKFNEGSGNVINDATGNGTNLTGEGTPTWVNVELPE